MKYEVTFHDSHLASTPCDCEARKTSVDAPDSKAAAIAAFVELAHVAHDADFLPFAQDPANWKEADVPDAWLLDAQESECVFYPLTVRHLPL